MTYKTFSKINMYFETYSTASLNVHSFLISIQKHKKKNTLRNITRKKRRMKSLLSSFYLEFSFPSYHNNPEKMESFSFEKCIEKFNI